jgi:hypothetical protein
MKCLLFAPVPELRQRRRWQTHHRLAVLNNLVQRFNIVLNTLANFIVCHLRVDVLIQLVQLSLHILHSTYCFLKTFPHVLKSPQLQSFNSTQIVANETSQKKCTITEIVEALLLHVEHKPGGCFRVSFEGCCGVSFYGYYGAPSDNRSTAFTNSTVQVASRQHFELDRTCQLDKGGDGISIDTRGRQQGAAAVSSGGC